MKDDLIFTPAPKRRIDPWAYAFLAPALLLLALFLFYPALWTIAASFGGEGQTLAGVPSAISAYVFQLESKLFWRAILNTLYFAGFYVPGSLVLGYLIASLIRRKAGIRGHLRVLFFLPAVIPTVAAAAAWQWMYEPGTGAMNLLLQAMGLPGVDWLNEPYLVLPAVAITCIWQGAGIVAAIYMAALWAVPREYDEMADLDGARGWRRLIHVTLPSVKEATFASVLLLIISAHRIFAVILVMTGDGGPANWSTNLPFLVYRQSLKGEFRFNSSAALSVMLCFTISIMAVLLRHRRIQGRELA